MRTSQKIAAAGLLLSLGAAVWSIVFLGQPSTVSAKKKAAAADTALVDQTPFKTATQLAQLADTPEEQELAKEILRISDYELDSSFAYALQEAEAHPPALSAEAKSIQERLQKVQNLQQTLQAQVDQLTAALAKSSGAKKEDLQDQLDLASASLDVANNDVDDANRDLSDAGGNRRDRIAKMKAAHEEADKSRKIPDQMFPQPAVTQFGLIHQVQRWFAIKSKKNLLQRAKSDADNLSASLSKQHDALAARVDAAKLSSLHFARHAKLAAGGTAAPSSAPAVAATSPSANPPSAAIKLPDVKDKSAVLAAAKAITLDQRNLASLDKRVDNEKELASDYAQWLDLANERERSVMRNILISIAIVLAIALIGLFFNSWLERILGKVQIDRRQVQTLRTTAQVSVEIVAVLFVLLVIFGLPGQLGTFLGLAGAGLTVALKDFIVGFLGWFVLMGKNGIRLGDWVEINGVAGEVVEIGLFHTVLLETGNWTDSGHPTGRRVTFTNSYAIEGHYFNFSTTGQWLWDELQIVLPTGDDPYPMIEAIQKRVLEATRDSAKTATQEWKGAAGNRDIASFSVEPSINLRPVLGGIELSVRYITQANQRSQLRTKLNQAAVELLGRRGVITVPTAPTPSAPAA